MESTKIEPLLLRVRDSADVLGCSPSQIRNLVASGDLKAVRLGRAVRIPRRELVEYVDRLTDAT